ncbi:MAG: hypothetical protein R3D69_12625 [Xanthobacteraceae bacterium]
MVQDSAGPRRRMRRNCHKGAVRASEYRSGCKGLIRLDIRRYKGRQENAADWTVRRRGGKIR